MSVSASVNVTMQPLEPRRLLSAFADAQQNTIAFDSAGRLHLAYYDAAAQDLKYAVRAIDGTWSAAGAIDAAGDVGHYPSLRIDPSGRPGIAYFDATQSDLKYAHLGPDGWTIEAVDTPRRVGLYPSLAYDADGTPHISYYNMHRQELRLAVKQAADWSISTIDSSGDPGRHTSLALHPSTGAWSIAYTRSSDGAVMIMQQGEPSATMIHRTPQGAADLSLALDPQNRPALSYFERTERDLRFARFDGSSWRFQRVASGGDQGRHTNLFFAADGNARIIHYNRSRDSLVWAEGDIASGWQLGQITTAGGRFAAAAQFNDAVAVSIERSDLSQVVVRDVPASPRSFASAARTSSSIELTWIDNAFSETGYVLERSLHGLSFSSVAILPPDHVSHIDADLLEGTSYTYRLSAQNGAFRSPTPVTLTVTTQLKAPPMLSTVAISDRRIDLSWPDASNAESGYHVERSLDGSSFTTIATLPADATFFSDTNLSGDTLYTYRVTAFSAIAESPPVTAAAKTFPSAPYSMTATCSGTPQVTLQWQDAVVRVGGYYVERSLDNDTWSDVAALGSGDQSYIDSGAPGGATIYYRIRGVNADSSVAYSNIATVVTPPAAPASLTAAVVSSSQINLTWPEVAGESYYELERSLDGSSWSVITSPGEDQTSYDDSGLAAATTYHYRLRAIGAGGASAYSSVATATTDNPPSDPDPLAGTIVAGFTGGNGSTSADQFPGIAGDGWLGPWQSATTNVALDAVVKTSGDAGYSPLAAGGSYLQVTTTKTGMGQANSRVGRRYGSLDDVSLTQSHVIRFKLRIDSLGDFSTINDRFTILDDTQLTADGTAAATWMIRAYGATAGGASAGKWAFYDGIRNDEATPLTSRLVSSTMDVVAGVTYSFTITTNPQAGTWSVAISSDDAQAAVSVSGLGFRTSATTAGGLLNFVTRIDATSDARRLSLDSIGISAT